MKRKISYLSLLHSFTLGAIVMAYIADYNRSQLPWAIICLSVGIISDISND